MELEGGRARQAASSRRARSATEAMGADWTGYMVVQRQALATSGSSHFLASLKELAGSWESREGVTRGLERGEKDPLASPLPHAAGACSIAARFGGEDG